MEHDIIQVSAFITFLILIVVLAIYIILQDIRFKKYKMSPYWKELIFYMTWKTIAPID
jgi:hypothetical protein